MTTRPHSDTPRDDALDSAWRAHSTELPPPHLDAAILAAAHREAHARPRAVGDDDPLAEAREPSRAWWGLAAAATIGAIAFGILHMLPPEETPSGIATDMPASTVQRTAPSSGVAASRSVDAAGNATPGDAPATKPADRTPSSEMARAQPPEQAAATAKAARKEEAAKARRDDSPLPPPVAGDDARRFAEQERSQAGGRTAAAPASPPAAAGPAPAPSPAPPTSLASAASAPAEPRAFPGATAPLPAPAPPTAAMQAPPPPSRAMQPAPAPPLPTMQPAPAPPSPAMQPAPAPPTAMASAPAPETAAPRRERVAPLPSDAASAGGLSGTAGSSRRDEAQQAVRKQGAQDALRSTLVPDQWIERIVELYDAGKRDDAARELRAFRDAYADADERLPRRLRPWASGVTR